MRLLQIVHSREPGGVLTLAGIVADGLEARGIAVETAFLYGSAGGGGLARLAGAMRMGWRILRGDHDGLIAYQATASIIAGGVGWLRGTRLRIVHQTIQPAATAAPIRWLDRVVGTLGLYPANVVNSVWTRSQFDGYPRRYRDALLLIEHGLTPPRPSCSRAATLARYGVPDDGPILLNTGRLVEQKNQAVLIEALPQLPNARLVIAGGGHLLGAYQALAAKLGVAGRLHLLGALTHAQTAELYGAADLFVFPSMHETFGISAVEAAMLELPIVAADLDVLREVLTVDGQSEAAFVAPQAVADWVGAIRQALALPPEAGRLRAFARTISQRFSETAMIDAYQALIHRVAFPARAGDDLDLRNRRRQV